MLSSQLVRSPVFQVPPRSSAGPAHCPGLAVRLALILAALELGDLLALAAAREDRQEREVMTDARSDLTTSSRWRCGRRRRARRPGP